MSKSDPSNQPSPSNSPATQKQSTLGRLSSWTPVSWLPYIEVTRLHKPAGIIVIYLPYLFGALFTAIKSGSGSGSSSASGFSINGNTKPSPGTLLTTSVNLALTSTLLRSAGCTWNDVADYNFDREVARCCHRPVARGAITPLQGSIFFAAQAIIWMVGLWLWVEESIWLTVPCLVLVLAYPFAKRWTHYPQVFLGVTLAWGLGIGAVVAGADTSILKVVLSSSQASDGDAAVFVGFGALFMAYVAWTAVYDTIYAFQDVGDDEKAGVCSMAVRWRGRGKIMLGFLACLQVGSVVLAGWAIGASEGFFVVGCGATAAILGYMIWSVDLENPESCAWWFRYGILDVGGCMTMSLVLEYIGR